MGDMQDEPGTRGDLSFVLDPYGAATATVNVIGKPAILGGITRWYDPSAYSLAATGVIGNSGRSTLRGPYTNIVNAALLHEPPIRDRANVEFRWEVFDISNTPLFDQPNNSVSSGALGQITNFSGDPRLMQLALRLSY